MLNLLHVNKLNLNRLKLFQKFKSYYLQNWKKNKTHECYKTTMKESE